MVSHPFFYCGMDWICDGGVAMNAVDITSWTSKSSATLFGGICMERLRNAGADIHHHAK